MMRHILRITELSGTSDDLKPGDHDLAITDQETARIYYTIFMALMVEKGFQITFSDENPYCNLLQLNGVKSQVELVTVEESEVVL